MLGWEDGNTNSGKKVNSEIAGGESKRVDVSKKRLINNNQVDVNQLMPLKYKWAW